MCVDCHILHASLPTMIELTAEGKATLTDVSPTSICLLNSISGTERARRKFRRNVVLADAGGHIWRHQEVVETHAMVADPPCTVPCRRSTESTLRPNRDRMNELVKQKVIWF